MPLPHADAVPQVSLVIPIRNEAGNIGPLIEEITSTLDTAGLSWELLVIDDGSTDTSPAEVATAAAADCRIRCLSPHHGRGKSAALATGFAAAQGVAVVMLDGDGQDDPAEIPGMLARLGVTPAGRPATTAEAELVNGWKTPRLDPWHKTMPSRVFNLLVSWLTGLSLHDHNCGLKAMLTSTATRLPLNTGMHRFIPVLAQAAGSRVVEQPVHHRRRTRGFRSMASADSFGASTTSDGSGFCCRLAASNRLPHNRSRLTQPQACGVGAMPCWPRLLWAGFSAASSRSQVLTGWPGKTG